MSWCTCNPITEYPSGGISCGGSASVDSTEYAGVVCSGSAIVDILQDTYDGFEALYPLDDGPTTFLDLARHHLDGTAGVIGPTDADGVFCLTSQYSEETEGKGSYIDIPMDTMLQQPFSVSLWIRMDSKYRTRVFYSRSHREGANDFVFSLGHSYLNHLYASVATADGVVESYTLTRMEKDRWYHCACTYNGSELSVYINGEIEDSVDASGVLQTHNAGYIGRLNDGGYPTCYMQELRVHPLARSEAYITAEYQSYCDSGFVVIGEPETL